MPLFASGALRKREGAMDGKWFFIYRKLIKNTWKVKIRTFGAKGPMFRANDVSSESNGLIIRTNGYNFRSRVCNSGVKCWNICSRVSNFGVKC